MPGFGADIFHQRSSRCDELYLDLAIGLVWNLDVHIHLSYCG